MVKNFKYNIIIPVGMNPMPRLHEQTAASVLADFFQADVYFLIPANKSTPDISSRGIAWEIKSPLGSSSNCIQKNMREAAIQSNNIVIDLRRTRLNQTRAIGYITQFTKRYRKIQRTLVITKRKQVLTIK